MKLQNLLLLSPLCFVACAGQSWQANAGPMFARMRGEIALQNTAGDIPASNSQNSLSGNMSVGDTEVSPYVRLETNIDEHRVRLGGFYVDAEGSGTLNGDFGDITSGTQVRTTLDFFGLDACYGYQLLREDHYRLAVGGKLGFYSLDIAARSTGAREEVITEVIVPMPWAEAELIWEDLTFGANAGIIAGDLGDANGRYWDIEAYGKWQINQQLDVQVGYRYLLLDGYGRASSRDFDADVDVQGLFVTGGVRF